MATEDEQVRLTKELLRATRALLADSQELIRTARELVEEASDRLARARLARDQDALRRAEARRRAQGKGAGGVRVRPATRSAD